MSTNNHEIGGFIIDHFEYHTQVSRDVNAAISSILTVKGMIVEDRMKRFMKKYISPFFEFMLLFYTQSLIPLFEFSVKADLHSAFKYSSISSAEENTGERFFLPL